MSNSFIANINALADKLVIIEESNNIFNEGVIPILEEISNLDLTQAIEDLRKGNYLGNRKLDINVVLNVEGITQDMIDNGTADEIWTDPSIPKPEYSKAIATFDDGTIIELPFLNKDMEPQTVDNNSDLSYQFLRNDDVESQVQVSEISNIVAIDNTLYTVYINQTGDSFSITSDSNTSISEILIALNSKISATYVGGAVATTIAGSGDATRLVFTSTVAGNEFVVGTIPPIKVIPELYDLSIVDIREASNTAYTVVLTVLGIDYTCTYHSGSSPTNAEIATGIVTEIGASGAPVTAITDGANILISATAFDTKVYGEVVETMTVTTVVPNVIAGSVETEFNRKLENTSLRTVIANAEGFIRFYDVAGGSSNLDLIELVYANASLGAVNHKYFWAKTTSAFQTLSTRSGDIIKLGNEIDNLIKLSTSIEQLLELQNRIPQFIDTYNADGVPQNNLTIYNKLSELTALYDILTELITLYSIRNDIVTVSNNVLDVNTVADNIVNVNKVGTDITNVNTVATHITNVDTVSDHITNVDIVATDIDNINTVADSIVSVNAVAANKVNIDAVNANKVNIDINAANIVDIQNAEENANIAITKAAESLSSANASADSALLASQKNLEIKSVSVGTTITSTPGTPAFVSYNSATGKFAFAIPQGSKGDKGEAFQVNSTGFLADRGNYDTQLKGFSFLAIDTAEVYFKLSNSSGDWSIASPFGKGDTGATGADGVGVAEIVKTDTTGLVDTYTVTYTDTSTSTFTVTNAKSIVSNTFTSTTDISGLPAQGGATDTYTIVYNDGPDTTYEVYNGIDGSTAMAKETFIATAGQDTFVIAGGYTPGLVQVYMNGLLLANGLDVDVDSGTEVILVTPTLAGTVIDVVGFGSFQVADTYTQAQIDAKDATKQDTLVSGASIKTINGTSVLGGGDITITEINDASTDTTSTWSSSKVDSNIKARAVAMAIALS